MATPSNCPGPAGYRLDDAVLAVLFAQSPIGLHIYDTQLRLVRANTAARNIREFPIDRMLGRSMLELMQAFGVVEPEALERMARDVLERGEPALNVRFRVRSHQAPPVERVVSLSCFRLQDPDGTVLGVVAATPDVTEQARAEAGLRLLNRAAVEVGTTLDIFRTAAEFCEIAVPELADTVVVDVLDPVVRGEAPAPDAAVHAVPLRRAGFHSMPGRGGPAIRESGPPTTNTHGTGARSALQPELIQRLDPGSSRDTPLIKAGVHSMMVVPMQARRVMLGLACFYRWRNPIRFDQGDLILAEQLVATATARLDNARLYSRERSVARILQRNLRHPASFAHAAVDTAHAFLPAGAGGGWFDVIPLSGARVALAVGDPTDPALKATAAMGELRAAMSALSELDLPPDELLARLHDLASRPTPRTEPTEPGEPPDQAWSATCVYAIYDPVTRTCTVARAGHPAPALVLPDGRVELLDVPPAPPLGQGAAEYGVTERILPEGSLLLLFNSALLPDGGQSARRPLDRLRRIAANPRAALQDTCDTITQALAPQPPLQDTVLLLARTHALGPAQTAAWALPNTPQAVAEARKATTRQLADWNLTDLLDDTTLIVSELVTNAVRYAKGPIELRLIVDQRLTCEITDDSSTAPHLRRALDGDEGGRGLFITAQLTERWGVRPARRGKTIWAELRTQSFHRTRSTLSSAA
jgi:anti-sigma regulatory factor (Ser/Thr protein kinase)